MFNTHHFIAVDVMGTGHLEAVYYRPDMGEKTDVYERIAKLLQCETSEVALYDSTGRVFMHPSFPGHYIGQKVVAFAYDAEPVGAEDAKYTAMIVAERRLREFRFNDEKDLYTNLAKILKKENYRNVLLVKPSGKLMQFKKNRKCEQYSNWPFYLALPKSA